MPLDIDALLRPAASANVQLNFEGVKKPVSDFGFKSTHLQITIFETENFPVTKLTVAFIPSHAYTSPAKKYHSDVSDRVKRRFEESGRIGFPNKGWFHLIRITRYSALERDS